MSNYLRELLTDPRYSAIVEKVKRETPPPLEYESGRTPEDWIEASGVRKGWMACAQYFGVNYD